MSFFWLNVFLSILGVLFGFSGCFVFFIYHNIVAGTWAFFSGLFAAICLHLHYLKYRNRLDQYHSALSLKNLGDLGVIVTFISGAFFIWYLFADLYWHLPMMPIKDSYVIMAVWAFMTTKWGFTLYKISKIYHRHVMINYSPLIRHA